MDWSRSSKQVACPPVGAHIRKRVRVFAKFRHPSFYAANWPAYRDMAFVADDSYNCTLLFNDEKPRLKPGVPKKQVLGIALEPRHTLQLERFLPYYHRHVGRYLCPDAHGLPLEPFVEHHGFLGHLVFTAEKLASAMKKKKQSVSMVVGRTTGFEGHRLRGRYLDALLKTDLPIHFYGRNKRLAVHQSDLRVKGTFGYDEIEKAYAEYMFSIAIENSAGPQYITEKFHFPILMRCVPIYWGCPQIATAYGSVQFVHLPTNVARGVSLIAKLLRKARGNYTKMLPSIDRLRQDMLHGGSLLVYMWSYFGGRNEGRGS